MVERVVTASDHSLLAVIGIGGILSAENLKQTDKKSIV